jgi:putative oxidoreductase
MHPHESRVWDRPDESASSSRPASARLVDPEDDLPSATYGGDFETTTIPHYNSTDSGRSGLQLLADPEPLPYVEPGMSGRHAALSMPLDYDDEVEQRATAAANRRGTQDLGLLLLRAAAGAILIAHGLQKVFGLWGGSGLDGFRNSLNDQGYHHADLLTYVAAGTQISAGVLLVIGLFTPLAAAAALAYLVNGFAASIATQYDSGYIGFGANEYQLILIVTMMAIILIGPGRYGLDAGRGWALRPRFGSMAALIFGIAVGVGIWMLLNGHNPLG